MHKSHWDLARDAKTMGVTTTLVIDPTKVTIRVKNKISKWLEVGYLEGGYRSEARKLADMLVKKYNLEAVGLSWRGVGVVNPSPELVAKLVPILDADWTATILENPSTAKGWYQKQYKETREQLLDGVQEVYLTIHDKSLRAQAGRLVGEMSSSNRKQLVKSALDAINGNEPIHVYTHLY
jgi:hypothetical protein